VQTADTVERLAFTHTDINRTVPEPQNSFFDLSMVIVMRKMRHYNFPSTFLILGALGSMTSSFGLRFPYFLLQNQGYFLVHLQNTYFQNDRIQQSWISSPQTRYKAGSQQDLRLGLYFRNSNPINESQNSPLLPSKHLLLDPVFMEFC